MKQKNSTDKSEQHNLSQISKIIKQSKTFFIAGHVKPDGDSLGSALALSSVLKRLDKKVVVCCADETPEMLKFLYGSKSIKKTVSAKTVFDCAIILESVDFSRMGNIISPKQAKKIINIDHHSIFNVFGDVNYIVPDSSSTAELVFKVFEYMKINITKNEAECLYTGLMTDTGSFKQLNTNVNSHLTAAKLISYGISPNAIFKKVYENNSVNGLRLLGLALSGINVLFNGKLAYMTVTRDMLKQSSSKYEEAEGIINFAMSVKGIKVACLLKEIDKNITKASFRSDKSFNVLEIVKKFNGGGHKNAAGCTLKYDIDSSIKIISDAFKEKLNAK